MRTDQLGHSDGITTSGATLFTVGTGKRAILKSLVLWNGHSATQRVILAVMDGATELFAFELWPGATNSATATLLWLPYLVMREGWSLKITPALGTIHAYASGASLTLP